MPEYEISPQAYARMLAHKNARPFEQAVGALLASGAKIDECVPLFHSGVRASMLELSISMIDERASAKLVGLYVSNALSFDKQLSGGLAGIASGVLCGPEGGVVLVLTDDKGVVPYTVSRARESTAWVAGNPSDVSVPASYDALTSEVHDFEDWMDSNGQVGFLEHL